MNDNQNRTSTIIVTVMLLLIILATCAGCTTVPVQRSFPDVPKELLEKCPYKLKLVTNDPASIVDLTGVVVENYTTYYECAVKHDAWVDWYNTQKLIFNSVK